MADFDFKNYAEKSGIPTSKRADWWSWPRCWAHKREPWLAANAFSKQWYNDFKRGPTSHGVFCERSMQLSTQVKARDEREFVQLLAVAFPDYRVAWERSSHNGDVGFLYREFHAQLCQGDVDANVTYHSVHGWKMDARVRKYEHGRWSYGDYHDYFIDVDWQPTPANLAKALG